MQIQYNANLVDHHFTRTLCCHTKLVIIKMLHKCVLELNDKCVDNQPIGYFSNHIGLDVVDLIFQS
jgi:hypothetical protein